MAEDRPSIAWEDEYLCKICWDTLPRRAWEQKPRGVRDVYHRVKFYDSPQALDQSAKTCDTCYFIIYHMPRCLPIDHGFNVFSYGQGYLPNKEVPVVDTMQFSVSWEGVNIGTSFDCFADVDSPAALSNDIIGRKHQLYSTPLEIAQSWLEDCFRNHKYCRNPNVAPNQNPTSHNRSDWCAVPSPDEAPPLPPRVLDIGPPWNDGYVALLETNEQRGQYVALTYLWGTVEVFKTTSTNLESHTTGLAIDKLNRTFRNTIDLTRKLGFRYLWIDALCIIQGSRVDWLRHARMMSSIYTNATLTISATGAKSANSHLLPTLKHTTFTEIPYMTDEGQLAGHYYLRQQGSSFPNQAVRGALSRRGWCLQERILSRRIIHCGALQMQWECRERFRSENDFVWNAKRHRQRIPVELQQYDTSILSRGGMKHVNEGASPERDFRPWDGYTITQRLHLGEMFSTGASGFGELRDVLNGRQRGRFGEALPLFPFLQNISACPEPSYDSQESPTLPISEIPSSPFHHEDPKEDFTERPSESRNDKFEQLNQDGNTSPESAGPSRGHVETLLASLPRLNLNFPLEQPVCESNRQELQGVISMTTQTRGSSVPIASETLSDRAQERARRQRRSSENLDQIKAEAYDAWYRVIQEYTKRETTLDTDRLPALAGVAGDFAVVSKDKYVSGLWAGDIAYGLLWERGGVEEQNESYRPQSNRQCFLRTPSSKRACSWSWAALDGPRRYESMATSRWVRSRIDILIEQPVFTPEPAVGDAIDFADIQALTVTGVVDTFEALTGYTITKKDIHPKEYSIEMDCVIYAVLDAPEHDPFEILSKQIYLLAVTGDFEVAGLLLHVTDTPDTYRRVGMGGCFRLTPEAEKFSKKRITIV